MKNRWIVIKKLDQELKEWKTVGNKHVRPPQGWVKTLRLALRMTADQLANRLGVTRSRITQLEYGEIHDAITIRTLKTVAAAMDCDFFYAIVPKQAATLESMIKNRALSIASQKCNEVPHSNAEYEKNVLLEKLLQHPNKKLWSEIT